MSSLANSHAETLSLRGKRATEPCLPYIGAYIRSLGNQYHPETNKDGVICLCVAENKLSENEVKELFEPTTGDYESPGFVKSDLYYYNDNKGMINFKAKMCRLLKSSLKLAQDVSPENICCSVGTGVILENLALNLCDHGDGILIPSPYYPAFDNDLSVRAGCDIFSCPMAYEAPYKSAAKTFVLSQNSLEYGLQHAISRGAIPKLLVLTNPNNPTGTAYSRETILMVLNFAYERQLHVISDEIYARTVYDDAPGLASFVSALTVVDEDGTDALKAWAENFMHIVYGFSKDFCVSGFRIGVLHSKNQALNQALDNVSYFSCIPSIMQDYLMKGLFAKPDKCVEDYTAVNNAKIRTSALALYSILDELHLEYVRANSGIFVFVNFSSLLDAQTVDAEKRLHTVLYEKCRVLFTPGYSCHGPPGWMRVCFAWVPLKHLKVAFENIKQYMAAREAST
jgi:1-aminocyclopropane-1-carboxylate synthase